MNLLESKKLWGEYTLTHIRNTNRKNLLVQRNQKIVFANLVTDVGKLYMLGSTFSGVIQITDWYLGLITTSSPVFNTFDTAESHLGWVELNQQRQPWVPSTSTGSLVAPINSTFFNITANGYVSGAFLIDDPTLLGTTGLLFSEGSIGFPIIVQPGDIINLGYRTGL